MTKQQRQKMLEVAESYCGELYVPLTRFICVEMDQNGVGSLVKEFTEFYVTDPVPDSPWATQTYMSLYGMSRSREEFNFKALLILLFLEVGGKKGLGE